MQGIRGLVGAMISQVGKESVFWDVGSDASFTGCSAYFSIFSCCIPFGPTHFNDKALSLVWKSHVSFKIKAFAWRIFINRLSTKDLLSVRGLHFPADSSKCVLYGVVLESLEHFFILSGG